MFQTKRLEKGIYEVLHLKSLESLKLELREDGLWHVVVGDVDKTFAQKQLAKNFAEKILSGDEIETLESEVAQDIEANKTEPKSDEEIILEQRTRFDAVDAMARMTLSGHNKALIVSGPAGVGKTFGVQQLCDEFYDDGAIRYEMIKGYMRPLGLYMKLFEYQNEGDVLVIDDCDSVFRDEVGLNLLKVALDTGGRRIISWNSKSIENCHIETEDGDKIQVEKRFEYKGTIIFLTNLDFDALVAKDNKLSPHFEALMSRSHYIDVGMQSAREKLLRVFDVCYKSRMLQNQCGLEDEASGDVINFMSKNINNLREISLRAALKIGLLRGGGVEKWKEMARVTCLK